MASIEPRQTQSGRQRSRKSTNVDMTAMVDVAFLLLTFFILTTTLQSEQAMQVAVPAKGDAQEIQCSKNLTFYLGGDNKVYWYGGCEMDDIRETGHGPGGVRQIIAEQKQLRNDLIVSIKPGEKSDFQNLVNIFDEMKITGVPKYALASMTPEEKNFLESRGMK